MTDPLVRAAVEIFGPYNYDDKDKNRRERRPVQSILNNPVKTNQIAKIAKGALSAIETADSDPKNHHRWGYQEVGSAGDVVLRSVDGMDRTIAGIATSELDPDWVLEAKPEEVIAVAGIMKTCRDLARKYMQLDIRAVNAD